MDKIVIDINDAKIPCKLSYRAFKEFESQFKPIDEIRQTIEDTARLFYCGLKAGATADNVPFDLTFEQFEFWLDDNMHVMGQFKALQQAEVKPAKKK